MNPGTLFLLKLLVIVSSILFIKVIELIVRDNY